MTKCGKKTEIFSRICGYFRPVCHWNKGKQEEFRDRLPYGSKQSVRKSLKGRHK